MKNLRINCSNGVSLSPNLNVHMHLHSHVCIHLCICEFHRKVKVLFGAEMKEKPLKKSHWPRFHP